MANKEELEQKKAELEKKKKQLEELKRKKEELLRKKQALQDKSKSASDKLDVSKPKDDDKPKDEDKKDDDKKDEDKKDEDKKDEDKKDEDKKGKPRDGDAKDDAKGKGKTGKKKIGGKKKGAAGRATKTNINLGAKAELSGLGTKSNFDQVVPEGITAEELARLRKQKSRKVLLIIFSAVLIFTIVLCYMLMRATGRKVNGSKRLNIKNKVIGASPSSRKSNPVRNAYMDAKKGLVKNPMQSDQFDQNIKAWEGFLDKFGDRKNDIYVKKAKDQLKNTREVKAMYSE